MADSNLVFVALADLSYEDAYKELQTIAEKINGQQIGIDALGQYVQRASDLLSFCQSKLRVAEEAVGKVLDN